MACSESPLIRQEVREIFQFFEYQHNLEQKCIHTTAPTDEIKSPFVARQREKSDHTSSNYIDRMIKKAKMATKFSR